MTVPTPEACPIPTYLHHSQVIRIIPEHPMPLSNPLAPSWVNSHLSNALPNRLTPLHLVNTFPTWRSFDLPFLTSSWFLTPTLIPDPTLFIGRSPIVYLSCSIHPSPSFLALYISVSLLSAVHSSVSSFTTLHSFLYVSSSVPHLCLPSFHLSLFLTSIDPLCYSILTLQLIPNRSDHPDPYHTCTCINTPVTSCCSSVW